jgi:hypothetical protein
MIRARRLLALLVVALISVSPAVSQEPKKKDGKKRDRDPQAALEPRSGPGAGQKFLEKFVGEWTVEKSFFRANGEAVKSTGTCLQTMIHGGRFLNSEFTFGTGERASTGTGIIGFDSASGKFTSTWVDSRATRFSNRQSKEPFDGKQITLAAAGLTTEDRPPRNSRTVTTLEDDGKKIIHRQFGVSPDGGERLVMQLVMTKTAK